MFTWICPICRSDVPPSYSECPTCAERAEAAKSSQGQPAAAPAPQPPPPTAPPPMPAAPPLPAQSASAPVQPPPHAAYPPQPHYAAPPRRGVPGWLVTLGVAGLLVGVGYAAYSYSNRDRTGGGGIAFEAPQESIPAAKPAANAATAPAGVVSKHLEVAGLRIYEDKRKPMVRFLVVNHSSAELPDGPATITINTADGSKVVAKIKVRLNSMQPLESTEFSSPLNTNLRAYELPDWQFLRAEIAVDN